jgi:hypothetical protein
MRLRALGLLLAIAGIATACSSDDGGCGRGPVLIPAQSLPFATSCAATVRFQGVTYAVGCARVHPSRVGDVLGRGGGSGYGPGREIVGVDYRHLFLLEGGSCGAKASYAATGEHVTHNDYEVARSPLEP